MRRRAGRKGAAPSLRGLHLVRRLARVLVRAPGLPAQVSLLLPLVRGQAQAAAGVAPQRVLAPRLVLALLRLVRVRRVPGQVRVRRAHQCQA